MPETMFAREVAQKLEVQGNAFISCRSLSVRARDINVERKARDANLDVVPSENNSAATSMIDFSSGRITFEAQGAHEQLLLQQAEDKKQQAQDKKKKK
ncbi:MAG: hypothetical protein ACI906_000217 [Candidatus Latescibacterota bacterium]|jgi:hypothetical protein